MEQRGRRESPLGGARLERSAWTESVERAACRVAGGDRLPSGCGSTQTEVDVAAAPLLIGQVRGHGLAGRSKRSAVLCYWPRGSAADATRA